MKKIYRRFERMTEEEQKETGYPTEMECVLNGWSMPETPYGSDPFLKKIDIEVEEDDIAT